MQNLKHLQFGYELQQNPSILLMEFRFECLLSFERNAMSSPIIGTSGIALEVQMLPCLQRKSSLYQGDQENEIFSYLLDRVKLSFTGCPRYDILTVRLLICTGFSALVTYLSSSYDLCFRKNRMYEIRISYPYLFVYAYL